MARGLPSWVRNNFVTNLGIYLLVLPVASGWFLAIDPYEPALYIKAPTSVKFLNYAQAGAGRARRRDGNPASTVKPVAGHQTLYSTCCAAT